MKSRHSNATARPILIVSTGHTYPELAARDGDFDDWVASGLGADCPLQRLDAQSCEALPRPADLAGVVLTGSHAMVTDLAPWSERLAAWLRRCLDAGTPLLGICYGHQLLAHAAGGRVSWRGDGLDIGTHCGQPTAAAHDDPLFTGIDGPFDGHLVHSQSVVELPRGAVRLAHNEREPNLAFRLGRSAWGVQFHPEFSAAAMRFYLDQHGVGQSQAGELIMDAVRPTPAANALLKRFAELVLQGASLQDETPVT